jgi:hypothetical protein
VDGLAGGVAASWALAIGPQAIKPPRARIARILSLLRFMLFEFNGS